MNTNDTDKDLGLFDLPKGKSNVIKVIGVGGGGCNAVNHMFLEGIKGVDYVVCNTDAQALENSPVTNKIQLGVTLTEGLGAGADPTIGEKAAEESLEEISKVLENNTKMVFITAGMGGGTGTGAAPIIARKSKELGILTVGIVTSPFIYEGLKRSRQAKAGIEKLRENVDSLIVINNNKLTEIYGDMGITEGLAKADEVLMKGAKGMAEVISKHYTLNIDLRDANTVLKNGGTAIMGSAIGEGENRAFQAIEGALNSPLLNDNKITGAKNALVLIVSGSKEATTREVEEINYYIQDQAGDDMADIIMGVGKDDSLGEALSVTVIATGFDADQQREIVSSETKKVIHVLDETKPVVHDLTERKTVPVVDTTWAKPATPEAPKAPQNQSAITSMVDLFNIWVSQELVLPEEKFTIIEKPQVANRPQQHMQSGQSSRAVESTKKQDSSERIVHQLGDTEENQPRNFTTKAHITTSGEIRHSLNDYMELEETLTQAHPSEVSDNEVILYKRVEPLSEAGQQMDMFTESESNDPFNNPIPANIMKTRSNRLQDYNYKFNTSNYTDSNSHSRTSISRDSSGEIQFRKNNSFLHDNVD
ncbi:cell division protein FtsZ [Capnocytophaga canis]|uniref:Cell division protein FtsZ n=1 Tax=Capnocytophaga canis TaxID=1848903 RepID=A0A0B7I2Y7_9FLAO|nr:cell division protein FtsZ [Capnocytophaga canis]CEN44492.1 Cell division protein FtsZ [Capnocytophaga canis]